VEKCDEKRPSLELLLRNTAHVAHKSYSEDTADNDSDVGMNDSDTESEDNSVLQAARDRVRATEGSLHWCFRGSLGGPACKRGHRIFPALPRPSQVTNLEDQRTACSTATGAALDRVWSLG